MVPWLSSGEAERRRGKLNFADRVRVLSGMIKLMSTLMIPCIMLAHELPGSDRRRDSEDSGAHDG